MVGQSAYEWTCAAVADTVSIVSIHSFILTHFYLGMPKLPVFAVFSSLGGRLSALISSPAEFF